MDHKATAAVEVALAHKKLGKPPLVYLRVNLVLRNPADTALWFLVPASLPGGKEGGVNALEVRSVEGSGRVIVGRFLGTGTFQALLLPPHAEIRLRDFPVSYWGALPEGRIPFPVRIASELTIGGQAARAWFGMDPTSDTHADVSRETSVSVHETSDGKEVVVSAADVRFVTAELDAVQPATHQSH